MPKGSHPHSELRKDYIQEKYVIIAPRRKDKPHDVTGASREPKAQPPGVCGLCPEFVDKEKEIHRVGPKDKWHVKVVPNRFPILHRDNPNFYGRQELVIETRHPDKQPDEFSEKRLEEIIDAYAARTKVLSNDPKVQYIIIFKNNGGRAGASMHHSHSQIFATDFIPPHLVDKSKKAFEYKLKNDSCVYCDTIAKEMKGRRKVYEDTHVVAFTPYASMHNYELWILPKRHIDNVTNLNRRERHGTAHVLKRALQGIAELGLSYNYYFHQVIEDTDQHLYMKITPRGSVWAGLEIGSGLIVNPVSPEEAAKYYRKWLK